MKVFEGYDLKDQKRYVVSVGMFDGVHKGHQKLIHTMKQKAREKGLETLIMTFDVHPRVLLNSEPPKSILTREDKIALFKDLGVDNVVFAPFNNEIALMSAEDFVRKVLVDIFHAAVIVMGDNHRFGNKQQGDLHFLEKLQAEYDFETCSVSPVLYDGTKISSTWVRQTILQGKLRLTRELLDRFYHIKGVVVNGDGRGSELGFPTANLDDIETKLPFDGIYSSYVEFRGEYKPAMAYIGFSPTFDGENRKVEVHIFDFDEKIYGEELKVFFVAKIRDDEKFDDPEVLKRKLFIDKNITLNILADEDLLFE
ncbi:bifunctional riboflavin kinase/FAD synthetase [Candidatus Mcinerneyibacteriota bacterium]|nr:bifunctional riboflavin kinase/FAD synthetase [Candidatus Mcinerneyibacteriota bacterium]